MNTSENFCKYCSKEFNFKYLYDRHIITCEFFYQSRRRQDIENNCNELLPSAQEQFKLIQYLFQQLLQYMKRKIQNRLLNRLFALQD